MTDSTKIFAAFVKAQTEFGPALKTHTNPAFKSRYADLSACVEAVIDALNANGIGLMQKTHPDERGVTVETLFVHSSGEVLSGGTLHIPAAKSDPQGFGSALSYARRYSLMAACGIAPEDDDGNAAVKAKQAAEREERRKHWLADQFAAIDAAANSGELKAIVAKAIEVATVENDADAIAQVQAAAAIKFTKAKPKARTEETA